MFIALTELIKKLNCSDVMFKLVRHKELLNISHKICRRIGLMCPNFLKIFIKIEDTYTIKGVFIIMSPFACFDVIMLDFACKKSQNNRKTLQKQNRKQDDKSVAQIIIDRINNTIYL